MRARLRWPRRLAQRLTLTSSLQLLLVAGAFGLLSYNLGRRSGLQLSEVYRQNASVVELSTRLSRKLSYPIWINQLNLRWLAPAARRLETAAMVEQFWNQIQVFPVDYINYGGADGAFIGMERHPDGRILLNEDTVRSGRGVMTIRAMQANGRPGPVLERIPGMSPTHEEAWYVETAQAGRPLWSSIYSWEDQPEVFSIAYNAPLLGADRRVLGVVGVDVVLSHLSSWLQEVWSDRRGLALIVEPDGDLVASSRPSLTFRRQHGRVQRSNLSQLTTPLSRALREQHFRPQRPGLLTLRTDTLSPRRAPERLALQGTTYTLQASPWGREEGLNWILLTALEADPGERNAARLSLLSLLAAVASLVAAALLSQRQTRNLLRPLRQLEVAAVQLSRTLPPTASSPQRADPLGFAADLPASAGQELLALEQAISTLVEGYNARSRSLREAQERERFRDAQTMALLKDKLRSSLQAAAVAHEINQPLSVLLLNSQLLLQNAEASSLALPEAWQEQLRSIRNEAERVVSTIEAMRTLLRNVQTEHTRLNLVEVAQSALLYARTAGPTAVLPIDSDDLDRQRQPAWVEGDAVQIQIAIVNLLRNAAEALIARPAAEPGQPPWIGLHLERQGPQWWLSVEDNGPGLAGDPQELVPLGSRKPQGSGLGLFVVRTTMENHGGQLECLRSPRGGALMRLRFPGCDAPAAPLPTSGD